MQLQLDFLTIQLNEQKAQEWYIKTVVSVTGVLCIFVAQWIWYNSSF